MSKKNNAVNSSSYDHLISLIGDKVKVMDLEVRGKWLVAHLSSGIKFWVLN